MKSRILFIFLFLSVIVGLAAQSSYPITSYTELANPTPRNIALWSSQPAHSFTWGNTDTRYKKEEPVTVSKNKTLQLTAWKGERVSAQFVVSNRSGNKMLSYEVGDFINQADASLKISSENVFSGFVRYVMTDELNPGGGACGHRNPANFDSSFVADPIDHHALELEIKAMTTQPVWLRLAVPENTVPEIYNADVKILLNGNVEETLKLSVKVQNHTLPAVLDWKFHLDLWQNPYSISRYYGVEPWSQEHLDALKYEHKLYADAGGKVITASIIYDPWNGQTEDIYGSMIEWIKKTDGSWDFDYTIFDKWVELMMSLGVDKQINCYSMIPWKLSFRYFDEASNKYVDASTKPGEALYTEMWTAMLKDFAAHLKAKGWFNITHISMDERPMDVMQKAIAVIRNADPEFKISLAGAYHSELVNDLDDYCVALRWNFTDQQIEQRRAEGKITTYYTSCEESRPNTFTFSPPAESEWFAWYAAKANFDGYLRWALNCWVQNPLTDSRFRSWAAGDTYLIYPGARTSMRFERMIEGIQQFEKIRILKDYFKKAGYQTALTQIDNALAAFDPNNMALIPAENVIVDAKKVINSLGDTELNEKTMLTSMIDSALDFVNKADKGEDPGQFSSENTNILNSAIADATSVRDLGTSDAEFQAARLTLWDALETYKNSKYLPLASTDSEQYWYSFHTPLRGSMFITYPGNNNTLVGSSFKSEDDSFLWKLSELNDGTFAIVSKSGNSNISNKANYDKPLNTSSTMLTSGGWEFTPTGDANFFIITSGNVQMNQTNPEKDYQIYN